MQTLPAATGPDSSPAVLRLRELGYAIVPTPLDSALVADLRASAFRSGEVGRRCLLDEPTVRRAAIGLREILVAQALLDRRAKAIQAIAFDKTPDANWKVTWHQDLMFPFAGAVSHAGFELRCQKHGVDYARPPHAVLESLVAVRFHVDGCDQANGPLRVAPGTHMVGVIPGADIATEVSRHGEVECTAREGESLVMKPLLLHASSAAVRPRHRRVLHLVYHGGDAMLETWHRTV